MNELKSIRIDKDVHKKLKIFCSENDLMINFLLERIIMEYIEKNNLKKSDNNKNS